MRIRVELGINGTKREIVWWKPLEDFPRVLNHNGKKWSWFMYDQDKFKQVDWVLIFSEIPSYDPEYWVTGEDLDEIAGFDVKCECGAIYTSFPWDHMRFCNRWKPW